MSIPTSTKKWTVEGSGSFDNLKWHASAPLPKLGQNDVLVQFHAASLNYRDLIIAKGQYPFGTRDGVTPGSDGAGEVIAVGESVSRFQKGDKVLTLFNQKHLAGPLNSKTVASGLGGLLDGTLREYGVFNEEGLVTMPSNLSYEEGSTLSCAAVTAWDALYGIKPLMPGDTVLTQGTGGVSIFALQFALAAGARVIATTSSKEKAETLKKLGAHHVINYKEDPNWGKTAKSLTADKEGVTHVVEVGGPKTLAQSLEAVRMEGLITIIGFLVGQTDKQPTFLDCLQHQCTVRGVIVGSRLQFEAMNRAIEANNIKPVVDKKVFKLEQLKDAYQYMWDQKHFGKLVVTID